MSVVLFFQLLFFKLIQQAALVNFMLLLNIWKISKISFWTFWKGKWLSVALCALYTLKLYKAFRIVQCKSSWLVKPWLNFGLNFRFKSFSSFTEELKKWSKIKLATVMVKRFDKSLPPSYHSSHFWLLFCFSMIKIPAENIKRFFNLTIKPSAKRI